MKRHSLLTSLSFRKIKWKLMRSPFCVCPSILWLWTKNWCKRNRNFQFQNSKKESVVRKLSLGRQSFWKRMSEYVRIIFVFNSIRKRVNRAVGRTMTTLRCCIVVWHSNTDCTAAWRMSTPSSTMMTHWKRDVTKLYFHLHKDRGETDEVS